MCICMHGSVYVSMHMHMQLHKKCTQNLVDFYISLLLLFQKGQTTFSTKDICWRSKYIIFIEAFGGRSAVISETVCLLQALRYQGKSSAFQFIVICEMVSIHFLLSSSSVQEFSSCRTSLYLSTNWSYVREVSSFMKQSRFYVFSSSSSLPSSASLSLPSPSFFQTQHICI